MKNKNIKIKHRKYSLYQRKKSKTRKVLTVLLMIVLIAGLCVLGYGLGRPLLDYFNNRGNESETSSAWTPPTGETSGASSDGSSDVQQTSEPETSEPAQENGTASVFILPESAVLSSESLNGALAAAKNSGCTDILVTLKDEAGYFLYKTSVSGVSEEQMTGSLTAQQISSIITKAGFVPRARINTLLDRTSLTYDGSNICYMIADGGVWHDYYVDRGGKSWLSPFEQNTAKYLSAITAELANSGFGYITLANTRYPAFNTQDYSNFLRQLSISDDTARQNALWTVIAACNSAAKAVGAEISLEMTSDELFSEDRALTNGEPAVSKNKLKAVTLLLDYTPDGTAGYANARTFISKMSALYPEQKFAVRLTGSGFSTDALQQVRKAFADTDIAVFSE